MTIKHQYLDMFDTTAYKLARLVQIPRYVKYLWGENIQCIKYWLTEHKYHNITLVAKGKKKNKCLCLHWLHYNVCGLN